MKRISTLLGRSKGSSRNDLIQPTDGTTYDNASPESPEGSASRAVRLFCESGSTANRDEEVLHLPTIVDAAESSPQAAAASAQQIRSFMQKQYMSKPHVQYNAIMLIRILSDNPGASFTRNFDEKFVKTVKTLLRDCRDQSVQQLLRETLDSLEVNRPQDTGLTALIAMWRREKGDAFRYQQGPQQLAPNGMMSMPPPLVHNNSHSSQPSRGQLPHPTELASRIEEARNTAKILIQFLQTTPNEEISSNELIREFAERCQSAQRSMQTYINCDNPPPDDDTLQTLIETNEQLSLAGSRYQRALLAARRAMGTSPSPNPERTSSIAQPVPTTTQHDRMLTPPPQIPPLNGFGTYQNGTHDSMMGYQQTYAPSISPPTSHAQPNLSVSSEVSSPQGDDYNDLYDSPRAARAPINNPFSDPVQHPAVSPPLGTPDHRDSLQYGQEAQPVSPNLTQRSVSPPQNQSPVTARPAIGAWHNSAITPSYLGRQSSAVDHLTMHAPGTPGAPSEIDGHSNVGRMDYTSTPQAPTSFNVTHALADSPSHMLSRVDVAGTGGFKSA